MNPQTTHIQDKKGRSVTAFGDMDTSGDMRAADCPIAPPAKKADA